MPFMAIYRAKDVTREQYEPYEAYIAAQATPPAALLHQVAYDDEGGLCVVDVWDNREALETFTANQINPALTRFGLPIRPPEVLEIAAAATHDGIDRFKGLRPSAR